MSSATQPPCRGLAGLPVAMSVARSGNQLTEEQTAGCKLSDEWGLLVIGGGHSGRGGGSV